MGAKFSVGEMAVLATPSLPASVVEIITVKYCSGDLFTLAADNSPYTGYGYEINPNPRYVGALWSEAVLRKLDPPADVSFHQMMDDLKTPVSDLQDA